MKINIPNFITYDLKKVVFLPTIIIFGQWEYKSVDIGVYIFDLHFCNGLISKVSPRFKE